MPYSHFDFKIIDAHVHFFPPRIFKAIWNSLELPNENGEVTGWPIQYKLETEELVNFLRAQNIVGFTAYNYAHKQGVAEYINDWTYNFAKTYQEVLPFGSVWPDDKNKLDYITKIIEEYNFIGIKIQPLVQKFYPDDPRMHEIYEFLVDRGCWICFHAGTAPYRNKYIGYDNFIKFMNRYPDAKVIVAHMGAYEYKKFMSLFNQFDNFYLDTTMIYIPDEHFRERKYNRPTKEDLLSYEDRILFGSDFPNLPYDYSISTKGLLDMNLPKTFYDKIFYENAKRLLIR